MSVADLSGWGKDDLVALLQRLVVGPPDYGAMEVLARARTPAAIILAMGACHDQLPPEEDEEAQAAVEKSIDYFRGRAIKMRLMAGVVNGRWYDRVTAPGAFCALVAQVKKERGLLTDVIPAAAAKPPPNVV